MFQLFGIVSLLLTIAQADPEEDWPSHYRGIKYEDFGEPFNSSSEGTASSDYFDGSSGYIEPDLEPTFSLPRQPCDCSKAVEAQGPDDGVDYSDYIVGGYLAGGAGQRRPWMARITTVKRPRDTPTIRGAICGGALINKRYVLTASHCVCHGEAPRDPKDLIRCSEKAGDAGRPMYDPSKHHFVLLGLNGKNYRAIRRKDFPRHMYGVEAVKQNPWFRWKYLPNDIALIKLDRDVEFQPGFIEPICLPMKFDEEDQKIARSRSNNNVYSAGWGRTKIFCLTDVHGPVKHNKCNVYPKNKNVLKKLIRRFRKRKNKKILKNILQKITVQKKTSLPLKFTDGELCNVDEPPPKSGNRLCRKLYEQKHFNITQSRSESLRIFNWRTKKSTYCFSQDIGQNGWCHTFESGRGGEKWGWCDPTTCRPQQNIRSSRLKEVRMSLLSQNDCTYFDQINKGIMVFAKNIELCAAKKKPLPKQEIYIYNRYGKGKFRKLAHHNFTDNLGWPNYKLDYYVGGEDTCSGDSGGPLYTWIDGVPTLIGAVSRGNGRGPSGDLENGCAEQNFPGIYTRINRFLEWIHENSKDGNCY